MREEEEEGREGVQQGQTVRRGGTIPREADREEEDDEIDERGG